MRILAIETSCDDTGIAIIETDKKGQPKLLADLVSSQIKIHAPWGGVVPMLAKREHQKNLLPLLTQALKKANLLNPFSRPERIRFAQHILREKYLSNASAITRMRGRSFGLRPRDNDTLENILEREPVLLKKLLPFLKKYQKPDINLIAVTAGPGLEPALWVGINFARALSCAWNMPIVPVDHIEAHIIANWLSLPVIPTKTTLSAAKAGIQKLWIPDPVRHDKKGLFPAICLVVSGGHTQLILIKKFGQYEIIGETRDDAAGEAFDKVAKMLGLGYPGGPIIAKIAASSNVARRKIKFALPRPMINSNDFDFSFSGLKTATLYLLQKLTKSQIKKLTPAIAAEFQQAAIDVLAAKTLAAAKKYRVKTVMLSGGVAANDLLRDTLQLATHNLKLNFLAPAKNLCTDNAAMVALTAYFKNKKPAPRNKPNRQKITAQANLKIGQTRF